MHIGIISVAPPYRGGIAKHTSVLYKELLKTHKVEIINYSRQYPSFLFPGKSQYLTEYKNEILGKLLLDSINPLSWHIAAKYIISIKFDLLIFVYWHPFFALSLGTIASHIKKKRPSIKLISLCHNVLPHEKVPLNFYLARYFFKKMDGHLVQSHQTEREIKQLFPDLITEKRFHPLYNTFPGLLEKIDAEKYFKLSGKKIILFFGIIRSYKGFDVLLKTLSLIRKNNFHLLVAGECYDNKKIYIKLLEKYNLSNSITWHNKYIADKDIVKYFSAADVVVLPYRNASQSGIAQIAYNYNIPIVVTKVGGLSEVVIDGKSGYIIRPEQPLELASAIEDICIEETNKKMRKFIMEYKKQFSWRNFVKGIEELYSKI